MKYAYNQLIKGFVITKGDEEIAIVPCYDPKLDNEKKQIAELITNLLNEHEDGSKVRWVDALEELKPLLNEMFGMFKWHLWWNEEDAESPNSIKIAVYDDHDGWLALIYASYIDGKLRESIFPYEDLLIDHACQECGKGHTEKLSDTPCRFTKIWGEHEDYCHVCKKKTTWHWDIMS
ncbi:MAG: hypothetical protein WC119_00885 [Synergistaceae bacterium]